MTTKEFELHRENEALRKENKSDFEFQKGIINELQKQVEELKGLLKGILALKDLWLITGKVKVEHEGEARALFRMKHEIEQALKE